MRLFTAIDLAPEVRASLGRLLALLRPAAKISWSQPDKLHLTTKFIGEWPDARFEELKAALATVPQLGPFEIEIRGLGWYPNPHNPRVFWAGVQAAPALAELAREIEQMLRPLGVAAERRGFNPHLTLARVRKPAPLEALRQAVAALDGVGFGACHAESFHLYLSAGGVYTKLAEYPL